MKRYLTDYAGVFDADQIQLMSAALSEVWKAVETSGAIYALEENAELARSVLAKHIIEAAKQGERDAHQLSAVALRGLAAQR